jgi:hypothetical protein
MRTARLAVLRKPEQPRPEWAELMAKRQRKTLLVCRICRDAIHTAGGVIGKSAIRQRAAVASSR